MPRTGNTNRHLDLTGRRFGRLVAIAWRRHEGQHGLRWLCRCECGTEKEVRSTHLVAGKIKSCGCAPSKGSTTHGHYHEREYRVWKQMHRRCSVPHCEGYARWGGRGITVDPSWFSYERFLADMRRCPSGFELDRRDNEKGYFAANCRWASHKTNSRNTRAARLFELGGEKKTLGEWADLHGMPKETLRARVLRLGWSLSASLSIPPASKYRPQKPSVTSAT